MAIVNHRRLSRTLFFNRLFVSSVLSFIVYFTSREREGGLCVTGVCRVRPTKEARRMKNRSYSPLDRDIIARNVCTEQQLQNVKKNPKRETIDYFI